MTSRSKSNSLRSQEISPLEEGTSRICKPDVFPASDGLSNGSYYSAEGMRADAFEEQLEVIEEEVQGLRARSSRRGSDALPDDDIDIDYALEDLPPLPDLPEPPNPTAFEGMKVDGEPVVCAGIEFIQEASSRAQKIIQRVWKAAWIQTPFHHLPEWLKDNDFLRAGHRPQIQSFRECFRSIFRIHTETGNIWTHMLGCIAFIGVAIYMLTSEHFPQEEKWVFGAFFAGAIICMGFSFMFHTVYCHSRTVGLLFLKLDYCGIAILILGSFIPWLHFGFYCRTLLKTVYLTVVSVLAVAAVIVALWDKFSEPAFRPIRAAVFLSLGLSGMIPAIHSILSLGWIRSMQEASIHWLFFMGFLYVFGALMYAFRLPERFFPGRFDIWFQSHQIFHVFVVIAAFVHYHGISLMASHRFSRGACPNLPPGLEGLSALDY
ncbi:adiponectin receptor protein-like [Paramacrobiotus metropolitanus]|uniref:adiponectin receptor protein-like n=1 Tax=Paramacrobiotus metropolitanus TaxID=2943436 RepID=UPI0024457AD7|nr:adiponectin receptor protein-like [Paramacrobiotus metropolitanus]